MLYEIRYESVTGSGSQFVRADTDEAALATFCEAWGDNPPSC